MRLSVSIPTACFSVRAPRLDVRNRTTGNALSLVIPQAVREVELEIDWVRRTIRDRAGADRSGWLVESGLWTTPVPFVPGNDEVRVEVIDNLADRRPRVTVVCPSHRVAHRTVQTHRLIGHPSRRGRECELEVTVDTRDRSEAAP